MKSKIRIIVIFGGKSAEHEVSIASAKNIIGALDQNKYEVVFLYIPKSGKLPKIPKNIDVVFPALHGPNGEDGTIQGLLKLSEIPFVGAGVLGSAIGMDKDVQKRLLRDTGIKTAKFQILRTENDKINLPLPVFIKPGNMGSSVGVTKVEKVNQLKDAIKFALQFDSKVLAEEFISGREIEVSVLGGKKPIASLPGEIVTNHEFYDYDAKYIDENGANLKIPADLSEKQTKEFQNLAIKTFQVLECIGMARVDFFLKENGEIYVNEINTIPGFTNHSMFPKLFEASGIPVTKLLDKLISIALKKS